MASHTVTLTLKDQASKGLDKIDKAVGEVSGVKSISITSNIGSMMSSVGGLATAFAGVAVAAGGVTLAISQIGSAIEKASSREDALISMETLLGSPQAAKKRVEEIAKFAASTPYEMDELLKMNKMAIGVTGGDLATMEGMRLMGDTAAALGMDLELASMHLTRLYSAAKGGRSFGGELAELSQFGVFDEKTLDKLRSISDGKLKVDASETVALVMSSMQRYSGAMDNLSRTWSGKVSTMKDTWSELQVVFMTSILDELKPALDIVTNVIAGWQPMAKSIGENIAMWAGSLIRFAQQGEGVFSQFQKLGWAAIKGLGLGFGKILAQSATLIQAPLMQVAKLFGSAFWAILGNKSLWGGIGRLIESTISLPLNLMMQTFVKAIASILLAIGQAIKALTGNDTLGKAGESMGKWSEKQFSTKVKAGVDLPEILGSVIEESGKSYAEASKGFGEAFDTMGKAASDIGDIMREELAREIKATGFELRKSAKPQTTEAKKVINAPQSAAPAKTELEKVAPKVDTSKQTAISEAISSILDSMQRAASSEIASGAGYGSGVNPLEMAANAKDSVAEKQLVQAEQTNTFLAKIQDLLSQGANKVGAIFA